MNDLASLGITQDTYRTFALVVVIAVSLWLFLKKRGQPEIYTDRPDWIEEVTRFEKPTNKMILKETEAPCQPVTKIGGAPWWPQGEERPKCEHGHWMTFVVQINLGDLPGQLEDLSGLYSFHYCIDCQHQGNMSFGWRDDENKGYDVRVFQDLSVENDGLRIVGNPTIPPRTVQLEEIHEIPSFSDLPFDLGNRFHKESYNYTPPDFDPHGFIPSDWVWHDLKHVHGSKIGGHPTWVQNPEWPETVNGTRLVFLAQLDGLIGNDAAWPNGTVFLFVHRRESGQYIGEMEMQHT